MRKVRQKVYEMFAAECTGLSMVGKGANAQPIKVIRDDGRGGDGMSLKTGFIHLFKGDDDAAPAAGAKTTQVLAIAVRKGVDLAKAKAWAKAAGFSVDKEVEAGGAILWLQGEDEAALETATQVRLSDKVGVLCAFAPDVSLTSFDELLKQHSFIPGVEMASGIFKQALMNALFATGDKAEFAKLTKAAGKQFLDHLSGLVDALPQNAFKLDPEFLGPMLLSEKSADDSAARVAAAKAEGERVATAKHAEDITGLSAQITALGKDLGGKIGALDARIGSIETKTAEVETVAKAARDASAGTVRTTPEGERAPVTPVGNPDKTYLEMDTGMSRHRRRGMRVMRPAGGGAAPAFQGDDDF